MNWIQIDQILHRMIERHNSVEDIYQEAEKHFKWNRSQAEAAIDPLLKRHTNYKNIVTHTEKSSKRLRKK
jgi:hypothetical protein